MNERQEKKRRMKNFCRWCREFSRLLPFITLALTCCSWSPVSLSRRRLNDRRRWAKIPSAKWDQIISRSESWCWCSWVTRRQLLQWEKQKQLRMIVGMILFITRRMTMVTTRSHFPKERVLSFFAAKAWKRRKQNLSMRTTCSGAGALCSSLIRGVRYLLNP